MDPLNRGNHLIKDDRKYLENYRHIPQISQEFPGSPVTTSTTSTTTTTTSSSSSIYKSPDIKLKSSNSSPSLIKTSKPVNQHVNTNKSIQYLRKDTSMSVSSTLSQYSPIEISPSPYSPPYQSFSQQSSPTMFSPDNQYINSFTPTTTSLTTYGNNAAGVNDILGMFPEEILVTFLSFLSVSDLYWCTFVCKNWKRLTEDEYLFKKICQKQYPCLSRYIRPPFESSWRKYYNMRKSSFLVLGGPIAQSSCMDDICKKMRECGIENIDSFYTQKRIPTLEELQKYTGVLIYSYNSSAFLDGQLMGDVLADYVDNGGGVVVTVFTNCNNLRNGFLKGRFFDQNYHPINPARQADTNGKKPLSLGKIAQPNHPILNGVKTLEGGRSSFFCPGAINPEAKLVAEWSNNAPLIADLSKNNGKVVALNFFPPSSDTGDARFWSADSGGAQMMANSLAYVGRSSALRRSKTHLDNSLSCSHDRIKDHGEGASNSNDKDYNQNKQKEKKHKFLGKRLPLLFKLFSKRLAP